VHRFVITFIMCESAVVISSIDVMLTWLAWKLWSDLALVISRFETDDLLQRIAVLVNIIALLGYVCILLVSSLLLIIIVLLSICLMHFITLILCLSDSTSPQGCF
jgi:hypothetical protein